MTDRKEANPNLDRVEIILVDTQDGANIGSVCRAMKTMGLSRLTLVTNRTYPEDRVKTLALHAFDVWENRKEFSSLEEALEDSVLSFAATRRHGKTRKTSYITPEELAQQVNLAAAGKISVVFGCEASGLTDEQVGLCSMAVTIPTSPEFPSLNLAQAVQIICYVLYTHLKKYPSGGNAVTTERARQAAQNCTDALKQMGYFKIQDEEDFTRNFLRDLVARASMTEGEVKRFEKIFAKTQRIAVYKNSAAGKQN